MRRALFVCLLALWCVVVFAQGVTIRNKNDPDNSQPAAPGTVTPNDASLVRFVVCYNDGIPYEVDNTSPYICGAPSAPTGTTYYVRTDGNNGNAGTTNSAGGAWLTITFASDNVVAGDTIRVQAGTYAEIASPSDNGTNGNPITYVADGAVTTCGLSMSSNSYQRWIGFVFDGDAGSCSAQTNTITISGTNHHLEFWNNTISNAVEDGVRVSLGANAMDDSIFIGNIFTALGGVPPTGGSGKAMQVRGDNNLIAYSSVHDIYPDGFYTFGSYNRYLNTYVYNLVSTAAAHTDVFQTGTDALGWSHHLYEGLFYIAGAQEQEHGTQFSNGSGGGGTMIENVFRYNVWHNIGEYSVGVNQTAGGSITYTRFYHNTSVDLEQEASRASIRYGTEWYGTQTDYGYAYNNIEQESWGASATSNLTVYGDASISNMFMNYNLAYDPDGSVTFNAWWSNQANEQSNVNPNFVDYANDDFHLGAGSGDGTNARGTGGPLTLVNNVSGTGTTFTVDTGTGGFFFGDDTNLSQYGGHLVKGDTITVGTDVLEVASVSGDAITVTTSFTWADNDPVYFGSDTTPDIGAYPYKAGGYTLTATKSGSPVGSTNFTARVYPLFASSILWATATN